MRGSKPYKIAAAKSGLYKKRGHEANYNRKANYSSLEESDRVLVK